MTPSHSSPAPSLSCYCPNPPCLHLLQSQSPDCSPVIKLVLWGCSVLVYTSNSRSNSGAHSGATQRQCSLFSSLQALFVCRLYLIDAQFLQIYRFRISQEIVYASRWKKSVIFNRLVTLSEYNWKQIHEKKKKTLALLDLNVFILDQVWLK